MPNIKFTNFARSKVATGINSSATTLAITGGTGALFPALTGAEYFYLTLENSSLVREIVKVTARATDTLTIVRAQDGTTAAAWVAGDVVSLRFNAAAISEAVTGTLLAANNLSDVANAATARANLGALAAGDNIGSATATTQTAGDNTTKVATTAFVQGELTSQAVKLTGNQTIAGTKTFSTQPVLPNAPALQTLTATASGTGVEFTSIPSWVKKITVMMHGTSTNGSSNLRFQIGPSGGVETSGYLSSSAIGTTYGLDAGGFSLTSNITSASISSGIATFVLMDSATNLWAYSATTGYSNAAGAGVAGGSKALAGTLSRLKLTTVNGTDTFDAGSVNILYE